MMTLSPFTATSPWVYKSFSSRDAILEACSIDAGNRDRVIRCLDGRNMTTVSDTMKEFANVLNFPVYFGANGNALIDCLTDLQWLPGNEYLIVIVHSQDVLVCEAISEGSWLINLLSIVCTEWATAVSRGEEFDRPAVAFNVVFQIDRDGPDIKQTAFLTLPEFLAE